MRNQIDSTIASIQEILSANKNIKTRAVLKTTIYLLRELCARRAASE